MVQKTRNGWKLAIRIASSVDGTLKPPEDLRSVGRTSLVITPADSVMDPINTPPPAPKKKNQPATASSRISTQPASLRHQFCSDEEEETGIAPTDDIESFSQNPATVHSLVPANRLKKANGESLELHVRGKRNRESEIKAKSDHADIENPSSKDVGADENQKLLREEMEIDVKEFC